LGKVDFEFNEMIVQAILRQQVNIKAAARQALALAEGWCPWRAYAAMYL
jgi:3-methyladenine DNA glycosylase/8-oxoguanine DNA glycosylase